MKKISWILLLFLLPLFAEATHQVSGYISFKYLYGTTYRVTLYDYTNTCNTEADRDTVRIYWGDGSYSVVPRSNGSIDPNGYPGGTPVCGCRKVSIYDTVHTFPGTGTYHITFDDQDRMANIANMTNSVTQDFFLFSSITINPFTGYNVNAPVITNPVTCVFACPHVCYYYNLGAYSPQGDSLSYSLGNCLTAGSNKAVGYYIPSGTSIDPITGTLQWCSPPGGGDTIYNFSIRITSYKKLTLGNKTRSFPVDTVECELEVIVKEYCTNDPPYVLGPDDTCVTAGDKLNLTYTAKDSDAEMINISASGAPFAASPPATATSPLPANPVTLNFNWNTNCSEVRTSPYTLLISAYDIPPLNNNPSLDAYKSTNIYVVGPAPTNLKVKTIGNTDSLHWNPSICSKASGYSIYRHTGCYKWIHGPCETGVPSYTGFTLIGTTTGLFDTAFFDNNGGKGLVPGLSYDYMVVANYPLPDGSVSYASNDTCVKIGRSVPVITNVSVDTTDVSKGTVFIRWTKPLADTADFDTLANPGPYSYTLLRANGISGNTFTPVVTYTAPFFKSFIDTTFKDTKLNTQNIGFNYRVDFSSNSHTIGSSATASSIYLSIKPDNNMLHLSWKSFVPWDDSSYSIYREGPAGPPFTFVATVPGTQHTYTDSNLTNLKTFCYYVESRSAYSDTTILHPLFDSSEVMCAQPKDTIPPCTPHLKVHALCDEYRDSLVWDNPDYFCPKVENRVLYYKIYFTPAGGADVQPLATIYNLKDTTYLYDSLYSIAGCFAVTAVDSFGNESPMDTVCVDNCPEYVLPNIFTPNGDAQNDFFTPILPFRYIKDIDIHIYNRWGNLVFHTIDPMVNWDGKDQQSNQPCSDGVYYYVCIVHEIHIDGIKSRTLKGFVQLLR